VLQGVAVCCRVLQMGARRHCVKSAQSGMTHVYVLQCVAVYGGVCCSVLQRVANERSKASF